jgi:hypothetical protein
MLKKIMLLGAALAALVAIAAPAAQASHQWKLNGTPIATDQTVTFTGPAAFELVSGTAGAHANATATIKLKAGTISAGGNAGTVTQFHVANCTGTGALNGLPCTPTTTEQNWPVTMNADTTLTIGVSLLQHYYANQAHTIMAATTLLQGPVIVDLDNPANISSGTLTPGEGLEWNENEATVAGELELTTGGTWSLG